jgi:hypothetical protein
MMEHLNQTIEPLLRLDKARECEKHTKRFGKTVDGEKKEKLLKKLKTAENKKIAMKEGKKESEGKTEKEEEALHSKRNYYGTECATFANVWEVVYWVDGSGCYRSRGAMRVRKCC